MNGENNIIGIPLMPSSKKRKVCDNNCFELVFAALLANENINNYDELLNFVNNSNLKENTKFKYKEDELQKFIADLITRPIKVVNKFISHFRSQFGCNCDFTYDAFESVYLTGKYIDGFSEIEKLNETYDIKSRKADVYVKTNSGIFIGFSIKQSKLATKSNYSVQKMLPCEISDELTTIKLKYLSENGFEKHDSKNRDGVNKLFYGSNPYFDKLKIYMEQYNSLMVSTILKHLYCDGMGYDIFEFDGEKIDKLTGLQIIKENVLFHEHLPFNIGKNGKQRTCAKLFYKLVVPTGHLTVSEYRVEIRWKGNVHQSSPQLFIHSI